MTTYSFSKIVQSFKHSRKTCFPSIAVTFIAENFLSSCALEPDLISASMLWNFIQVMHSCEGFALGGFIGKMMLCMRSCNDRKISARESSTTRSKWSLLRQKDFLVVWDADSNEFVVFLKARYRENTKK
jgi:hypothetical protein